MLLELLGLMSLSLSVAETAFEGLTAPTLALFAVETSGEGAES